MAWVTDDAITAAAETYLDHMHRKYRDQNGIVIKRSNKENGRVKLSFSKR